MTQPEPAETAADDAQVWRVCRQDDHGNRFVVDKHLTRNAAERLVAEFESHGHKQFYWVERETE